MAIKRLKISPFLLFFYLFFNQVCADEEEKKNFSLEGEIEIKAQTSTDSRQKDDLPSSLDLHGKWKLNRSLLEIKLEGNSRTRSDSITNRVDEGNNNSTVGNGRLQISELKHTLFINDNNRFVYGLIDIEHYLAKYRDYGDESIDIATVDFPDYTLGMVYQYRPPASHFRFTVLASSSHGRDDNPNQSTRELLDVSAPGKGVFYSLETRWESTRTELALGIWHNRHDVTPLAGGIPSDKNYGAYALISRKFNNHIIDLRYGRANPKLSEEQDFAGIGYGYRYKKWKFKLDYAYINLSRDETDPAKDDSQLTQLQLIRKHNEHLSYALIVRNIKNNEFDATSTVVDNDITIFGVKLKYEF